MGACQVSNTTQVLRELNERLPPRMLMVPKTTITKVTKITQTRKMLETAKQTRTLAGTRISRTILSYAPCAPVSCLLIDARSTGIGESSRT